MPELMTALCADDSLASYALRFAILTACRTGEVLGATWPEIDTEAALWVVPAGRIEHRVALSAAASDLLKTVAPLRGKGDHVFPGRREGRRINDHALRDVLVAIRPSATVHGFRSTFRDGARKPRTTRARWRRWRWHTP